MTPDLLGMHNIDKNHTPLGSLHFTTSGLKTAFWAESSSSHCIADVPAEDERSMRQDQKSQLEQRSAVAGLGRIKWKEIQIQHAGKSAPSHTRLFYTAWIFPLWQSRSRDHPQPNPTISCREKERVANDSIHLSRRRIGCIRSYQRGTQVCLVAVIIHAQRVSPTYPDH